MTNKIEKINSRIQENENYAKHLSDIIDTRMGDRENTHFALYDELNAEIQDLLSELEYVFEQDAILRKRLIRELTPKRHPTK